MSSLKAKKPIGTQLFGQGKDQEPAKGADASSKSASSKPAGKKAAEKPQPTKKKGKGGKAGGKK
ncbi:hypothetical protein SLEP1_g4418 [Rubroshorea leprosula]|uniref:Uncharacterized protein n=1 Tax=Rubroshorea leprosula TaxID=152421 RepID=A0AAV5HUM0_9ROSI|nr:hypothetical protein SLEP1_g4418 [Rubroshorea leprosula]